ncbi:hypothetical protein HL658_16175 [Azospirillum sp. RWY-5-1]|uniref:Uncharacterized protein n=1 Tax=Azospirillum oleiclasticum TaxID=2735135 RepID=A0ABX2TED9_9PROT|nr:hypothetical protein [Azospirillum oleiclasticum]NYZ14093.1 hypothetical protein [Azospirillum oleiclasticum]NYZ21577.1 hypothetical protein [Azospirillum oleiclasticum]
MRIARFIHLAEAHGGDLERWPVAEREAARELLGWSDEARRALEEAQALDIWLDRATPAVDAKRVERLASRIEEALDRRGPAPVPPAWTLPRLWPAATFLAVMGLMGVVVGSVGLVPASAGATGLAGLVTAGPSYLSVWVQ